MKLKPIPSLLLGLALLLVTGACRAAPAGAPLATPVPLASATPSQVPGAGHTPASPSPVAPGVRPPDAAPTKAPGPPPRIQALHKRLQALVDGYPGMRVGLTVLHIPTGERVDLDGDRPQPLASVFKVPIMIEVARQIQQGQKGLSLDRALAIREQDKCIGSGRLQQRPAGSQVPLRQAVELMETISDNTATDMVFELVGTDSVNRLMADLGLRESDIYLKNRPAWLISLGLGSPFRGMKPGQIASTWMGMSSAQRHQAARQVEAENQRLSLARFQAAEDASAARQSHAENVEVAAAVDNVGSSSDFAELLTMLWKGEILDRNWTDYCLGVLARQKYNTRIPRLLPRGTRVFHKTGTLAGIVNDAGIVEIAPGNQVAVVVFIRDIPEGQEDRAQDLIGRVARAAWETWR